MKRFTNGQITNYSANIRKGLDLKVTCNTYLNLCKRDFSMYWVAEGIVEDKHLCGHRQGKTTQ